MFKKILIGVIVLILTVGAVGVGVIVWGQEKPEPTPIPNEHIIPMPEPKPEPEPEVREYVYNPVEYYIAASQLSTIEIQSRLRKKGYNLSEKEIDEFREQYGIRKGDTVLVRGKAFGHVAALDEEGVKLESPFYLAVFATHVIDPVTNIRTRPQWLSDVLRRIRAGEEVVITVRGTADGVSRIKNCELVE